jgi:DNA-binding MarR family transcriptional regulator
VTGGQAPPVDAHAANLLGAVALALGDRVADAAAQAAGRSPSAAAALSALDQFLDSPSIDVLAGVLGLTHSGTVRLVDRLELEGFVRREPGTDARTIAVTLTAAGRGAARRIAAARISVLEDAIEALTPQECDRLDGLLAKVAVGLMREPGATRWMCRMCDLAACGRSDGRCPVEREAHRRYG